MAKSRTIRVSEEVWEAMEKRAGLLGESPDGVLRRILGVPGPGMPDNSVGEVVSEHRSMKCGVQDNRLWVSIGLKPVSRLVQGRWQPFTGPWPVYQVKLPTPPETEGAEEIVNRLCAVVPIKLVPDERAALLSLLKRTGFRN